MKKIKYVKESLNEDTGITRTDEIQNREVAQEILANKEELRQEYERGVYISIIAIAKKVKDGNTFENAFNKYLSEVGWFEHPNVQAKKKNYFDLLEICAELGYFIGDELEDILNHETDLMNESLNEAKKAKKKIINPRSLGEFVDGFEEKIYNPLTGYNDDYDYCKFEGDLIKKSNGKYVVVYTETIYHGYIDDDGYERESDIQEQKQEISKEFKTAKEGYDYMENIELEYEGETDLDYRPDYSGHDRYEDD